MLKDNHLWLPFSMIDSRFALGWVRDIPLSMKQGLENEQFPKPNTNEKPFGWTA